MIDDTLFVTGMQRSGTTLLERLLASQERVSILSQPYPLLFVEAKRAYLESLGRHGERYPLGHLFLDPAAGNGAFAGFLARWRTSPAELGVLFSRMAGYSGQYTRFTTEMLEGALSRITDDDDLAAVLQKLDRSLASRPIAQWFGSKETLCEEIVPYLLDRGIRCAIIIRDPRDVVASLNHGRGQEFGGEIKPTLFNVRNWRKSVAIALAMEGRPRFHWLRYEDLVAEPFAAMSGLVAALGIDTFDPERLHDFRGPENSSFRRHGGVTAASVGEYRDLLPLDVTREIEATCLPELQLLGYETSMSAAEASAFIRGFREPYATRPDIESDAATPANAALEIERLERLGRGTAGDPRPWFLHERAARRLREAFTS
jgi:hypothetical protein